MQRRQMLGVLGAAAGMAMLPEDMSGAQQKLSAGSEIPRISVTGIGGFFFRAKEPKVLAQWYQNRLGVFVVPQRAEDPVWNQQAGPTSFTHFLKRPAI